MTKIKKILMKLIILSKLVRWLIGKNLSDTSKKIEWCQDLISNYGKLYFTKTIWGYLFNEEMFSLLNIIKTNFKNKDITVVEIGSFQGLSASIISNAISDNSNMYCIDPFIVDKGVKNRQAYNEHGLYNDDDVLNSFMSNISKYGRADKIKIMRGYSYDLASNWDKEINFLFIDADHSEESVEKDFLDWSKFLKVGGIIVFHDTWLKPEPYQWMEPRPKAPDPNRMFGPARVVKKWILNHPEKWLVYEYSMSLFAAQKINI